MSFLQSAQGRLAYLCRAIPHGRIFLHRGYRLIAGKAAHEYVTLTRGYVLDLKAWKNFLHGFNGQMFFRDMVPDPTVQWYTDASTSFGAGSLIGKLRQFFVLAWPAPVLHSPESTALLEICPIVVSLFQPQWELVFRNSTVVVHCDNEGSCKILMKKSSGVPKIAKWLRCMVLKCMQLNCNIIPVWVPTSAMPSDPLSRNKISLFLSQVGGPQEQIFPRLSGLPSLLTLAKSREVKGQRCMTGHK